MAKAAGYVVISKDGKYLSRSMRWVRKKRRNATVGFQRAWVHSAEILKQGGTWAAEVGALKPALYDPDTGYTEITGKDITYDKFLRRA